MYPSARSYILQATPRSTRRLCGDVMIGRRIHQVRRIRVIFCSSQGLCTIAYGWSPADEIMNGAFEAFRFNQKVSPPLSVKGRYL